jgi:Rubredoxin
MPVTRRLAAALAAAPLAAAFAPRLRASEAAPDPARWADDPRLAQLWRCTYPDCPGYTYDPLEGEPYHDVAAGTAFEDLPADFWCPECGNGLDVFVRDVDRSTL